MTTITIWLLLGVGAVLSVGFSLLCIAMFAALFQAQIDRRDLPPDADEQDFASQIFRSGL